MKHLLLVVTASIAAYKAADLAHDFVKAGVDVHVIMTKNATNFIHPLTFETLTQHKCLIDTFDRNFDYSVEHISLAKQSDLVMVAPASADIVGKLANGIADDMATTTIMACTCPVLIAPAMNTNMYLNPIFQDNMKKLASYGYRELKPVSGLLACGDVGTGKFPPVDELFEEGMLYLSHDHDLAGRKVLVTAGPTEEALDPIRFLTNHSTGRMGYAIARSAARRGAEVTLITGKTNLKDPKGVELVHIVSAQDMADAVFKRSEEEDIMIFAAAVADYRPTTIAPEKIKKSDEDFSIPMERTIDILNTVGHNRPAKPQYIVGFAMESENLLDNAYAKLDKKGADMIVANSIRDTGAGFGTDTNKVVLLTREGSTDLPLMSKDEVGDRILDQALIALS